MNNFRVLARGIESGGIAAQMEASDFFTANNIYNDYVKSYTKAHHVFNLNQVVVAMLAKRDNFNSDIWDVVKSEIC